MSAFGVFEVQNVAEQQLLVLAEIVVSIGLLNQVFNGLAHGFAGFAAEEAFQGLQQRVGMSGFVCHDNRLLLVGVVDV